MTEHYSLWFYFVKNVHQTIISPMYPNHPLSIIGHYMFTNDAQNTAFLFDTLTALFRQFRTFCDLTLILRRSRTGTVWFYTSTSNKRAARPKLYTKSLTRDVCIVASHWWEFPLTFRHRASCILGQAFHYSPENAFYIFNQQTYFIIWYFLDRASLI